MKKAVLHHFQQVDPTLFEWANRLDTTISITPRAPDDFFISLCREIIFQQLSDKAGSAIESRFTALFGGQVITPSLVMHIPHAQLRGAGMSNSKAQYVKNIAHFFDDAKIDPRQLVTMTDDQVFDTLTAIKGVGRWTAEMFLIFSLGREDIFSFGDVGLRRAITKIYGHTKPASERWITKQSALWRPYRSWASLILWASLN